MKKVTFANNIISIALTAALGTSFVPAVAVAAEGGADGVQDAASTADAQAADEVSSAADAAAENEAAEPTAASASPISATAVVTDNSASAAPAMVSASASLSTINPVVLMTQDNVTYAVDAAQGAAVAVGVAKTAEGALDIPQNVTLAGEEIPVMGIDLRGGAIPLRQKWG